jgi:hypothetical protein
MRMRGLSMVLAVALLGVGFLAGKAWTGEDEAKEKGGGMDMSLLKPGPEHARLKQFVGTWDVASELFMDPTQPPIKTKSTATFEMILGGRYLLQKVTGDAFFPGGEAFEGRGITGYDRIAKHYHSTWFDNMGTGVMSSTGTCSKDGKVMTLTGSGDFGQGPMDFKEVETLVGPDEFTLEMFVKADGHEAKVMRLVYTRAK